MKVLIASKNQGKIEGATRALNNYFNDVSVEGVAVPSNVSEQPVNDDILLGAKNRVKNLKAYAKENNIDADMYMAVESGISNSLGFWFITNIAVVEDKNGNVSCGTSPSFPVPERYVDQIIATDLSQMMNKLFGEDENRRNAEGGIHLLTHGKVSRIDLTTLAFTMALTRFINKEWQ